MRTVSRSLFVVIALALVAAGCGDDGSVLGVDGSTTTAAVTTSSAAPATTEATATTQAPPQTTVAPSPTTEAPATTAPPPPTTEEPAPPVPIVTPLDASESYDDPPLEMQVVVPVISGVPSAAADAMNGMIAADGLDTAHAFRDDILGSDPPIDPMGTAWEFALDYSATAISAVILSLRFDLFEYYAGAAHGGSIVFTMNFDPQTGRLLALPDILVPGTVPALAALVEQHLIDDLWEGDAVEAANWLPAFDETNLDSWVVTVDGLEVSFDQYEVGYGAMGAPSVLIPWGELGAVIDPGGYAGAYAFGPG